MAPAIRVTFAAVAVLASLLVGSPARAVAVQAVDDKAPTTMGRPVVINVLVNDLPSGQLSVLQVGGASHGAAVPTDSDNTTVTYTPQPGFHGVDTFIYTAADQDGDQGTASVTVGIDNGAPTANDDRYTVDVNGDLSVPAPGVLGNDTDPDGDELTAKLQDHADGDLHLDPHGWFTYTPKKDFHGTDHFTYVADDKEDRSAPATVTIVVDDPPVAPDLSLKTTKGLAKSIDLHESASDPNQDAVTVKSVSQPLAPLGSVTLNTSSGVAKFIPRGGLCNGSGSFFYTVADPFGMHDTGRVAVTVSTPMTNPSLTISGPTSPIRFGASATIAVHISQAGLHVTLAMTPVGRAATSLGTKTTNSHGNAVWTLTLRRSTQFRASFAGNNCRKASTSDLFRTPVRAGVSGGLLHAYGRGGIYFLYHEHRTSLSKMPLYVGEVAPDHPGEPVTFRWQVFRGGSWRSYYANRDVRLTTRSRVAIYITSGAIRGPRYRVRIEWPGTRINAPAAAPWQYFRITK